jgi:hypothetical protein
MRTSPAEYGTPEPDRSLPPSASAPRSPVRPGGRVTGPADRTRSVPHPANALPDSMTGASRAQRAQAARTQQLLTASPFPLLVRLAAPNSLAFIVQACVSMTEVWYVGRLGRDASPRWRSPFRS